jgi:hypothetical protein
VLVVLAGVVGWAVSRSGDRTANGGVQRPTASPAATTSPAPLSGPSGSAPSPGVPSAPVSPASTGRSGPAPPVLPALPPLPDGWIEHDDPTGFSVYVPEGWSRSKKGSIVYFRSRGRVLGIDQTDEPQWNPVADWRGKADYRVARGDFPNYDEIHIREVDYFLKAADWEFTFNRSGVRQHVNNRGFITSRNQAYGIWWQTTDAAWDEAEDDLDLIFRSFRPGD